jgi:outer membrane lipoprotein-sorting protein
VNIFRRLPLNRLLLLLAGLIAVGVSVTAIASALDSGPVPPAKPLAQAVHDAMTAPAVEGVSAEIQLTDHLLEGASLATGGGGTTSEALSSPLLAGASGRLWISKAGDVRLELQAEKGDTQILYDGHTLSLYDAATNTLYRYTPPTHEGTASAHGQSTPPSVTQIEEAIAHLQAHANVSGATPTDIAGHAAYTVRVSPKETGSLLGGAELSFDASTGAPLRAAVYSSDSSAPVIELAATSVSYGPVSESVFAFTPPAGAKIEEVSPSSHASPHHADANPANKPKLTSRGKGLSTIGVLEEKSTTSKGSSEPLEGLPKVNINGVNASELRTELGTILSFERGGVRYVLGGSVTPSAIEELARGL